MLLLITFGYTNIVLCGLFAVAFALLWAKMLHFPNSTIENGYYGFNALLVGLGLGSIYQLTWTLLVVLFITSLFSVLIQAYLDKKWGAQKLYPLSLPFVLVFIIALVAIHQAEYFQQYEEKIFILNHYTALHPLLGDCYGKIGSALPPFWKYFFNALSSIFFLDDFLIGFILGLLLLFYSRVSFSLALLGFATAYGIIVLLGLDKMFGFFSAGYNFILLGIAVGGFFVIPSFSSYLSVMVLSFLNVFLTLFLNYVFFAIFTTPSYSLPFVLLTNLFIFLLPSFSKLELYPTIYQEYKPEHNLYRHRNIWKRFHNVFQYYPLQLPVMGKWKIAQGYNGPHTHKDQYQFALDFVVEDDGKTYQGSGQQLEDYFCYGQWVIAPGDGIVVTLENNVSDNRIGEVNALQNWGNTIVIKHTEGLYSQLSHLLAGSSLVRVGDFVYRGQVIARVGNSGRSPEPHLHFQVQPYPAIGSKPMPYPFARYKKIIGEKEELRFYDIPEENDVVENVYPSINTAFSFKPGMEFTIKINEEVFPISVYVDAYNQTYLYCHKTSSFLYVYTDYFRHYFTHYVGNKKSPLYTLYLACFTVELSFLPSILIEDEIPLHKVFSPLRLLLVDLVAPFGLPLRAQFNSAYSFEENKYVIHSFISSQSLFNHSTNKIKTYKILISQRIELIVDNTNNQNYEFVW